VVPLNNRLRRLKRSRPRIRLIRWALPRFSKLSRFLRHPGSSRTACIRRSGSTNRRKRTFGRSSLAQRSAVRHPLSSSIGRRGAPMKPSSTCVSDQW